MTNTMGKYKYILMTYHIRIDKGNNIRRKSPSDHEICDEEIERRQEELNMILNKRYVDLSLINE